MDEFDDLPTIEPGIYEHYKGNRYRVLGVACHSEVREYYVVYTQIHEREGLPDIWIRPYAMFVEQVTKEGKTFPRFKRVADN